MDVQEFRNGLHHYFTTFPKTGFYSSLDKCAIFESYPDQVLFQYTVSEEDLDEEDNLHNGCLATLMDVLMSLGAYGSVGRDHQQPGVTADLNITYLGKAKLNEKLIIDCETVKKGSRLAFLKAKVYKKDGGKEVIAVGSQTLAVSKNLQASKL